MGTITFKVVLNFQFNNYGKKFKITNLTLKFLMIFSITFYKRF